MKKEPSENRSWVHYMGLTGQIFGSALFMLALGWKADQWVNFKTPVFIWVLPLLTIVLILIKLVIDTNKKNK